MINFELLITFRNFVMRKDSREVLFAYTEINKFFVRNSLRTG